MSAAKKKNDAAKLALEIKEKEKAQAAYNKRVAAHLSFHGLPLTAAIQISAGQQLGAGLHALPHPHGWLSSDNHWLYPKEEEGEDLAMDDEDVKENASKAERPALVFAMAISKTSHYLLAHPHILRVS